MAGGVGGGRVRARLGSGPSWGSSLLGSNPAGYRVVASEASHTRLPASQAAGGANPSMSAFGRTQKAHHALAISSSREGDISLIPVSEGSRTSAVLISTWQ